MSGAPARGTVPRRQRRHHHHHHQKHQKQLREEQPDEPEEKRPKVNPIFLWASQREQRIVEVRCEDYDKRNRIKLTKTAQGWRSIPRTASNMYSAGLGVATQKTTGANSSSASETREEKEIGSEPGHVTLSLQRISAPELPNGRANGLIAREASARKRSYDEIGRNSVNRHDYAFSARINTNWDEERQRVPCSDDDEDEDEEEDENDEEEEEEKRYEKDSTGNNGRNNLERLQKDKLFQPRVVLEQLHFSQLPEGVHQSILQRREKDDTQLNEDDAIDDDEESSLVDNEKRRRTNKAGIQDILNMIDATASPVLATDTPSADLPVDSTKTYEILNENLHNKHTDGKIKDSSSTELMELSGKVKSQTRIDAIYGYTSEDTDRNEEDIIDEKVDIHEEKILENCGVEMEEEGKIRAEEDVVVLSLTSTPQSKSCKVAEADGGLGIRSKCKSNSHSMRRNAAITSDASLEAEEERPDEPGEPMKMDYSDSSKILDALRNTPGLSVSITRTHTPESVKNTVVPSSSARPSSKASSSSRSPDSQAECVERLLKTADSATENRVTTASPRNLPGLSIIIPSYRYRSSQVPTTHSTSPSTKARVESPESTVNFPKNEIYTDGSKVNGFPHEENDEDRDIEEEEEEEEDDYDSQVLEDLRRQKADSLAYDADADYFPRQNVVSQEEKGASLDASKGQNHWISSSRSSEAQAKCKHQDMEHFDEQVLEELRSRGTVVSPQPSGIPCSPASRRPSSAYLERLLPSPPCSVSCSEDAKNDLTLKGILASPSRLDTRDYDRQKDVSNQIAIDHLPMRSEHPKDTDRSSARKGSKIIQERFNVLSQDTRTCGRPMSSGDIHSTYFTMDRATPKRPMSAEWSIGRQKTQPSNTYQKSCGKIRAHPMEEACATSSSTDKLLDPASQLRELIEVSGHLIPDPLLVPRDYLPALAAAPATEIPKLLATRPELRLPEALTRPDLLRDPDLLVISLAHLQHVLDHGEGPVSRSRQLQPRINNGTNKGSGHANNGTRNVSQIRPKLSCKPIGTLMPAPIDLSSSRRASPYPPLLRVRSGLLKQEPEVSSTASSPDDSQLWHPLFGSQKKHQPQPQQHHQHPHQQHQHQHPHQQHQQQQHQQQHQRQHQHQQQHQHASWHRTTLAS